jgi:hypothetical protein
MSSGSPIIVLDVSQANEQITGDILEDMLVFIGKVFFPLPGLSGAEGRGSARVDAVNQDIQYPLTRYWKGVDPIQKMIEYFV